MRTRGQHPDLGSLPAGLLDELCGDPQVRRQELARLVRSYAATRLECPEVIDGIAEGILADATTAAAGTGDVASW